MIDTILQVANNYIMDLKKTKKTYRDIRLMLKAYGELIDSTYTLEFASFNKVISINLHENEDDIIIFVMEKQNDSTFIVSRCTFFRDRTAKIQVDKYSSSMDFIEKIDYYIIKSEKQVRDILGAVHDSYTYCDKISIGKRKPI